MIHPDILKKLNEHGDTQTRLLLKKYLENPYLTFVPRPNNPGVFDEQEGFINDKFAGIACAIGGTGSGKSMAGAYKAAKLLLETEAPDDLCKFFIVSESMEQAGTLWAEKLRHFITEDNIFDATWYSSKSELPRDVILQPHSNGNRWQICFRSYQQGRKLFQGFSQVFGYWVDEQIDLNLLNEIDARCREYDIAGTKFYTLTPLEVDDDLKERFDKQQDYPYWKFYRLNSEENYRYGGITNIEWLENTPEEWRETRRIGDFAFCSGAIFKEFDQKKHTRIIVPAEIHRGASWYRVIDFGFKHDTAVLLAAKYDDKIYITKEWGAAGMLIGEKVSTIQREMPGDFTTYADPEDAQQRAEFGRLGLPTVIARKEPRLYGLELVRRRMAENKLVIDERCKKLITQIKNYRWREDSERAVDNRPEAPIKKNDDYVDCLRMLVHSLEGSNLTPWDAAKQPIITRRI